MQYHPVPLFENASPGLKNQAGQSKPRPRHHSHHSIARLPTRHSLTLSRLASMPPAQRCWRLRHEPFQPERASRNCRVNCKSYTPQLHLTPFHWEPFGTGCASLYISPRSATLLCRLNIFRTSVSIFSISAGIEKMETLVLKIFNLQSRVALRGEMYKDAHPVPKGSQWKGVRCSWGV